MEIADAGRTETIVPIPQTLHSLKLLLRRFGIEYRRWGEGTSKAVNCLARELESGECSLVSNEGALLRVIHVVGVDVYFTDAEEGTLKLVETEQRFRGGRSRSRQLRTSLGEKQLPGESPEEAAKRAITEELGLPAEDLILHPTGGETHTSASDSYPGLRSQRHLVYFECDLPRSLFESNGYTERQPDKVTRFDWRAAA
ncbi:MAG TPA: NUDIX domain-containing protein [Solirubrobacterales bacterium]|nr:NUDIX domain-containing protein [Solirubrobacterales bacterium]